MKCVAVVRSSVWSVEKDFSGLVVRHIKTGEIKKKVPLPDLHKACVMATVQNDRVWIGTEHGMIYVFKAQTFKKVQQLQMQVAAIGELVVRNDDGYVLSSSQDGTIVKWDLDGQFIYSFKGHEAAIRCVLVVTPTLFLSSSEDGAIKVWDAMTGACLHTILMEEGTVFAMALCGNTVWTASEKGVITVWPVRSLRWEPVAIRQIDLEEDRKVTNMKVVGPHVWTWNDKDTAIHIWDAQEMNLVRVIDHTVLKKPCNFVLGVQTVATRYVKVVFCTCMH